MSEARNVKESDNKPPANSEVETTTPTFRIQNVVKMLLPVLLLGGAIVAFIGFFDGLNWLSDLLNPPLVTATGQLIYQGDPVEGAQLSTRHESGKMAGSIGWTDEHGRFSLQTDIDGYVEGSYAGEHQVIVTIADTENAPMLGAPANIAPKIYTSFATTPLRIVVSRNPEENEFLLKLEGEPPKSSNSGATRGRGEPDGGGFDADEIVTTVFETYDKDGDSQLSDVEIQAIDGSRGDRIRHADANKDGIVEREELLNALSQQDPE